jgi:hypothetical protein
MLASQCSLSDLANPTKDSDLVRVGMFPRSTLFPEKMFCYDRRAILAWSELLLINMSNEERRNRHRTTAPGNFFLGTRLVGSNPVFSSNLPEIGGGLITSLAEG